MSLVNILVAISLAAIASVVLLNIQTSLSESLANISNQTAFVLLDSDILRITENEKVCTSAFVSSSGVAKYQGLSVDLSSIEVGGSTTAAVGTVFDSGLRTESIRIVSKDAVGQAVANGYTRWDVDLQIVFASISQANKVKTVKSFPLSLKTNSSGTIFACGATAVSSSGASLGFSCDFQTALGKTSYTRTSNGKTYRVVPYAYFRNEQIDDGGGSGRDDNGEFYCVQQTTETSRNGFLGVCLSKESCQWR